MLVRDGQIVCDLCREFGSSWLCESTAEGDFVLAGSQSDQRPVPVCCEFALVVRRNSKNVV